MFLVNLKTDLDNKIADFKSVFSTRLEEIKTTVHNITESIKTKFNDAVEFIKGIIKKPFEIGFKSGISAVLFSGSSTEISGMKLIVIPSRGSLTSFTNPLILIGCKSIEIFKKFVSFSINENSSVFEYLRDSVAITTYVEVPRVDIIKS